MFSRFFSVTAFSLICSTAALAFGGKSPPSSSPSTPSNPPVTPPANPPSQPPSTPVSGMAPHYFLEAVPTNIAVTPVTEFSVKPSCLKNAGVRLIVLDPGHDDSTDSRRSSAKVRGGNGKLVYQWPSVHEGRLAMVTAWMAYDILMKDPTLSASERRELQTMIRFSRMPGEKTFGQYEKDFGYATETSGTITSGITNRANRVRAMMQKHRSYDPSRSNFLSASTTDVTSQTLMISVHANSSDYFDEGDVTWAIPPKGTTQSSATFDFVRNVVAGFSDQLGDLFTVTASDSTLQAQLKRGVASTVNPSRILTKEHETNLAMLSPSLGNSSTRKVLLEGFVMKGKAGHLAQIDIDVASKKMKLDFKRNGQAVDTYAVSNVYLAYAKSIAQSIGSAYGCSR